MTRLDVITMIGDRIADIDVARGSLMPDDPNRLRLDDLRDQLDEQQRTLAEALFNDNSSAFQQAANQLQAVNDQVAGTIQSVENIVTTLASVERLLNAVTSLVALAGNFV